MTWSPEHGCATTVALASAYYCRKAELITCDGRPRIEIEKPLKGWISLKLCGPAPPDAEAKVAEESELE